jgi:hypothetical protein
MDNVLKNVIRVTKHKTFGVVGAEDLKVGDTFIMEDDYGELVTYDNGKFIFRVDKPARMIRRYGTIGINVTPIA